MFPVGGDSWGITISTDPNIDFTVWLLRRDGLRARGFDSHPDGDGSLRTAGLTEAHWLNWFEHVVRTESEGSDDLSRLAKIGRHHESRPAPTAPELFAGPDATQRLLVELWPGFSLRYWDMRERDFDRKVRQTELSDDQEERIVAQERRQWDDMQRYRPLPPLHVYLVEYVHPVVTVCPPASVVVGLVDPREEDSEDYWALVVEGARRLNATS